MNHDVMELLAEVQQRLGRVTVAADGVCSIGEITLSHFSSSSERVPLRIVGTATAAEHAEQVRVLEELTGEPYPCLVPPVGFYRVEALD